MKRRNLLQLAALSVLPGVASAASLRELRLDYAYYAPTSLVLRRFGWLEEEFKADGTAIKWVHSAGSNRALEYLNANSIDIGSSAGLAALLAKANGNPIRAPYIFSRPEWTALVVRKDSPIRTLADLKGKKIAATKGTDPYLFLLRALKTAGLKRSDIEHVGLQHADGRAALEQGRVDAWAGLDPHMAASELEGGSRLIYRNVAFNTYGFLNVRDDFLAPRPQMDRRQPDRGREDTRGRSEGIAAGGAVADRAAQRFQQPAAIGGTPQGAATGGTDPARRSAGQAGHGSRQGDRGTGRHALRASAHRARISHDRPLTRLAGTCAQPCPAHATRPRGTGRRAAGRRSGCAATARRQRPRRPSCAAWRPRTRSSRCASAPATPCCPAPRCRSATHCPQWWTRRRW